MDESHGMCVYIYLYSTISASDILASKLPRKMAGGRGEQGALQHQCQLWKLTWFCGVCPKASMRT